MGLSRHGCRITARMNGDRSENTAPAVSGSDEVPSRGSPSIHPLFILFLGGALPGRVGKHTWMHPWGTHMNLPDIYREVFPLPQWLAKPGWAVRFCGATSLSPQIWTVLPCTAEKERKDARGTATAHSQLDARMESEVRLPREADSTVYGTVYGEVWKKLGCRERKEN